MFSLFFYFLSSLFSFSLFSAPLAVKFCLLSYFSSLHFSSLLFSSLLRVDAWVEDFLWRKVVVGVRTLGTSLHITRDGYPALVI